MPEETSFTAEGGCACGQARFRLIEKPIVVHCCHCTWCQRETGSAFAYNAMLEINRLEILDGAPEAVATPTASGKEQQIIRCPVCKVALWSHYAGSGPAIAFVRAGTLDDPSLCPPDVHIYTATKLPWVVLPEGVLAVEEYYKPLEVWSEEAIARYREARSKAE